MDRRNGKQGVGVMLQGMLLLLFLLMSSPAHAAEIRVHIPDHLIEEGAKWHHYYKEPRQESKEQFVLDRVIEDSEQALDTLVYISTWGRVSSCEDAGITFEVVE